METNYKIAKSDGGLDLTSTFNHNLSLPVHRWFKFTAGYSAKWCRDLIMKEKANGRNNILDPFVGSGTTMVECDFTGVKGIGLEAHPFISRIAKAKLLWGSDHKSFSDLGIKILKESQSIKKNNLDKYSPIVRKCYPDEVLSKLDSLKIVLEKFKDNTPAFDLAWLALVTILRPTSPVGTAQWQYLLPNRVKRSKDPFLAFSEKINLISEDMIRCQREYPGRIDKSEIFSDDARTCSSVPDDWADLIITSPPYANNYDYADAMRLEMAFFNEISSWGDLQDSVRKYLVRACTQHVASYSKTAYEVINDPILSPIQKELEKVCFKLDKEKDLHGGKKPYYAMIAYYFRDLANVWKSLHRVSKQGALACFVVGDSAPYGVYVPVDKWLGELALSAGFKSYTFEKTRDRNIKWKNRKHRVPLHEGRLWVKN